MKLKIILIAALLFAFPASLLSLDAIPYDISFTKKTIGTQMEYLEDKDGKMTIEQVVAATNWANSKSESLNFGFTPSVYWFRFAVDNTGTGPLNLFFEITYPLLNYVDFYYPVAGDYKVIKTGNKYPFSKRDIEDKNFVFRLKEAPGINTYYLRIETKSSLNFIPILMSQESYLANLQSQLPLIWIYYGLMLIMVVYNFIIFLASRDRSYLFYVLFIANYILFQMTLNGYSFQYLWPNAIWWGGNCLPFFMCTTMLFWGIFFWDIVEMRNKFKIINRILVWMVFPVMFSWAVASLLVKYSLAIQVATLLVAIICVIYFAACWIAVFYKSRPAIIINIGSLGLIAGVLLYVMKTFGFLPEMFLTEWGIQIGSAMVVILFSLALADKINILQKDMKGLISKQQANEKEAVERASYLEGIVNTATRLAEDFIKANRQLQEVTDRFSSLSMEQSATSEEMSSTFEELLASVDTIYHSTVAQKEEGDKSKQLADELNETQKGLLHESQQVEEGIRGILRSAGDAGESLKKMTERMEIINEGGKEIHQFVAMIDDISDRINLLSLNAAIEAARAGNYGRGFAVVADEIGKLAQATSDNSKEIAKKISKIISDIDLGASIVTGTKESTDIIFTMVNTIGAGINSVREMMMKQNQALNMVIHQAGVIETMSREIMTSTNEQKNSMEQTQQTIDRLSEMAQEIAQSNSLIIDFSKLIYEKGLELERIVRRTP